jgi:hypothetical protein
MTTLWKITNGKLSRLNSASLANEQRLEDWMTADVSILGLDVMLIGRQVQTVGGRIDILAMDRNGDLTVIELKRDKTPRDVVAQILDYASWINGLTTKDVHELALRYRNAALTALYRERFGAPLPENLNANHNLLIVAGSLDSSSERIVKYLADCGISINTAFFNFFVDAGQEYLTADWLMDQQEVVERSESKKKSPWTGIWYANAGDGPSRSWEDMRKYGFLAAGGGIVYSGKLNQLNIDDPVYVYQSKLGYVGYGRVTDRMAIAKDVTIDGQPLLSLPLKQPNLAHDKDYPELAEYVVRVAWNKAFPLSEAKTFDGIFANPAVVCRLRDPRTLEFLQNVFGEGQD